MKYQKHIFICTNQRPEGARKSCGEACGMDLVHRFKKEITDKGLKGKIRAQRAGCLDTCDDGPSVVVYPEGVFYGHVQPEDVLEIFNEHILNDRPVKRLMLNFENDNGGDQ